MKIKFYIATIVVFLISCNKNKEINVIKNEKASEVEINELKSPDVDYCRLCLNFLYDYHENYDIIYEKDIVNYDENYSINFENVKYFIDKSQMNKYFTEKYVTDFEKNLEEINKKLKNTPQNDGTIDGLEGDEFLRTQDIEECLNQIMNKNISCTKIEQNKLEIDFGNSHKLIFTVINNKIDDINLKK